MTEQLSPSTRMTAAVRCTDTLRCWHRNEVKAWRAEDIEQRVLNNAFLLWERYAESNRRFVEERAEQLKSFANLAALIAGFAIVSFLQVSGNLSSHA